MMQKILLIDTIMNITQTHTLETLECKSAQENKTELHETHLMIFKYDGKSN